ncbi:hypothetical protein [Nocardia anaemiae]|uniref:hypothetical protein n=1 Tax=Nocardia anaemiae TaxID=263910 RepID=UPI0007A4D008|nr:hypothetical protein [Nocardia anaemiae]
MGHDVGEVARVELVGSLDPQLPLTLVDTIVSENQLAVLKPADDVVEREAMLRGVLLDELLLVIGQLERRGAGLLGPCGPFRWSVRNAGFVTRPWMVVVCCRVVGAGGGKGVLAFTRHSTPRWTIDRFGGRCVAALAPVG